MNRSLRLTVIASLCATLLAITSHATALDRPAGGVDLTGGNSLQANIGGRYGTEESLAAGGKRIRVTSPDADKAYIAQFTAPCSAAAIAKGDRVFAVVRARPVGGDTGVVTAKLQFREAPYRTLCATTDVQLHSGWHDYPILFLPDEGVPAGKAAVVLLCGQKRQSIEVASLGVWKYPPTADVTQFPRIRLTYEGREPNAPWRQAALERIERLRKADLSVAIVAADGKPLVNARVTLALRRHEFGFGTAAPVKWFLDSSDDGRRWREIVDRYFSMVVFENDLKDWSWGRATDPDRRAAANAEMDKAFAWLAGRHIAVRGHYLMQVAIPPNLRNMTDQAIRGHLLDATRQRIAFAGERVCEWDAINHPVAWGGAEMLNARPGLEHIDRDVLSLARSLTGLPLWVNEDQLFRPGRQCDGTFRYLQSLAAEGHKIDGLGNQAHFHESFLPSPEHLLAVSDRFATIVPRQAITEFDVVTSDEDLAADYTRDVLIACFSHPAYRSFLWWGFWEGSHWKPPAASWNRDWTIRLRGEVIDQWLGKRWRTEVTLTTDTRGMVRWRGFPGWYEVAPHGAMFQVTHVQPAGKVALGK